MPTSEKSALKNRPMEGLMMLNVYANGVGAEKFGGVFDNTEIYHKLADLTKVK